MRRRIRPVPILGACACLLAFASSCGERPAPAAAAKAEAPAPASPAPADVAIANPASTNCLEQGGRLELQEDSAGQFGVCVFADGSRCEEWRFFRKECAKASCRETDGICEQ